MSFDPSHRFAVFAECVDETAAKLGSRNYLYSSDDYIQALAFFYSSNTPVGFRLGIVERCHDNQGGVEIDVDYFQGLEEIFARMNECRVTLMMPASPGKSTWPLLPEGIQEHVGPAAQPAKLIKAGRQLIVG